MDGYLLVDKPSSWTSFDVVAKVRSELPKDQSAGTERKLRVGHAGTLDPMATGLLILLIGNYTKRQDEFMKMDKEYEAEVTLGATSSTDDAEGKILKSELKSPSSEEEIRRVLESFTGEIEQTPPQHSAIKVNGKRAYNLARAGHEVELKPRLVNVYVIKVNRYEWPILSMNIRVSSGTYIRSLARDVGQKLGTGGYLSALRRLSIGPYLVSDAVSADGLNTELIQKSLKTLENNV